MALKTQFLNVDDNPMRAIGQLLGTACIVSRAMQETIRFMDVPLDRWHIRKAAMIHAESLEEQLKTIIKEHTEVCARLKEIGY